VIPVAARWYVRYDAPYRDVKKLLAEGGITVDHVTIYRWVHAALLKQLSRTDARAFTNALQKLTRLATGRVRTHPFEQAHHAGGEFDLCTYRRHERTSVASRFEAFSTA